MATKEEKSKDPQKMEKVQYLDIYFIQYLQYKILKHLDSRGKYTTEYVSERKGREDFKTKLSE